MCSYTNGIIDYYWWEIRVLLLFEHFKVIAPKYIYILVYYYIYYFYIYTNIYKYIYLDILNIIPRINMTHILNSFNLDTFRIK